MDVIPVLDLKAGRAVHARRGERADYRVVSGVLGPGDDVLALAAAFRDRLGCRTLYVADLDAIAAAAHLPAIGSAGALPLGRSAPARPAHPLLSELARLGLELWVDAGSCTGADAEALLDAGAARVVVGLETLPGLDALAGIIAHVGAARTVFSLDLRDGRPLAGDPALAARAPVSIAEAAVTAGAQKLIVLDLARVGTSAGPPWSLLRQLRAALPDTRLVAGGGVGAVAALQRLAELGCAGALGATALHEGRLTREDLVCVRDGIAIPG